MGRELICLDTGAIIEIFRGNRNVIEKLEYINLEPCTTSINVMELLTYSKKSKRDKYFEFLLELKTMPFDIKAAKVSSDIIRNLKSGGKVIDIRDVMIASICIVNFTPLYTLNRKHFERLREYNLILIE